MDKKVVNEKKPSALGRIGNLLMIPEVGVLLPILILCIVTTILKPKFLTWKYFSGIFMGCIFIGVEAIGQAFVK